MNQLAECEHRAYTDGLSVGLELALQGVDAASAPGMIAALPTTRIDPDAVLVEHEMAAAVGIGFVRNDNVSTKDHAFDARLGAVRLGVTRRLLEWATEHLSSRTSGGEPIIRKQLVLGVLADSHTELEAARHCLGVAADIPSAVAQVHDRITVLDWEATKLLGASGYADESPARGAYVSRLIANCWIAREES